MTIEQELTERLEEHGILDDFYFQWEDHGFSYDYGSISNAYHSSYDLVPEDTEQVETCTVSFYEEPPELEVGDLFTIRSKVHSSDGCTVGFCCKVLAVVPKITPEGLDFDVTVEVSHSFD